MQHMRLWVAAAIIALVVIVGFVLSVPHTRDIVQHSANPLAPATTTPVVVLHDRYSRGAHTLSGSLTVPNACTTVSAGAVPVGDASTTASILLSLSVPADTGVCLQLPTTATFSASVVAPEAVPIQVMVNGLVASTTAS
jgi:hypothetical protein